jgi:hypothetical protein
MNVYMRCRKLIWLSLALLPLWLQMAPAVGDVQALAVYAPRDPHIRTKRVQGAYRDLEQPS